MDSVVVQTLVTVIAGLLMLTGLLGVVIPVLPDVVLIWAAALGYGLIVGWGSWGVDRGRFDGATFPRFSCGFSLGGLGSTCASIFGGRISGSGLCCAGRRGAGTRATASRRKSSSSSRRAASPSLSLAS